MFPRAPRQSIPQQRLILIGGGHSHALVLRRWAMKPVQGVQLTLVADVSATPYSGMLPGLIAGFYTFDETHIDLRRLAQCAGARFIHARVTGIDAASRAVLFADRPPLHYELLSINTGSSPSTYGTEGAAEHAIPVKPVSTFYARWQQVCEEVESTPGRPRSFVVVGGGAGGVELILAMQQHFGGSGSLHTFTLVQGGPDILPSEAPRARALLRELFTERGITLLSGDPVRAVSADAVTTNSGRTVHGDYLFWTTQAAAPHWLGDSGIQLSETGFVLVNDSLQSCSHPEIFAAGDAAQMRDNPRPKSGVFAVRQGRPLYENLRRKLEGRALRPYRPQRRFLALIGTGSREAIASRGALALRSPLLWPLKDWIDRRFMQRFSELHAMHESPGAMAGDNEMRCLGCGAKVGAAVLRGALDRLRAYAEEQRLSSLRCFEQLDDAAILERPAQELILQTVDYLPLLLDDPFTFGRIAVNHCANDIWAMGGRPTSAMAIVTLPESAAALLQDELFLLLAGAALQLSRHGIQLLGGHTTEGPVPAIGFAVNGESRGEPLLRKGGMQPGERLVLTKALGTGTIFAAAQQLRARARWVDAAIEQMLVSNESALDEIMRHNPSAGTDVSGFGLAGHLSEMAEASNVRVRIFLEALPVLPGALEGLLAGARSSLDPENRRAAASLGGHPGYAARHDLLFDPQTSGGLLVSVPEERAESLVGALHRRGYSAAAVVGEVVSRSASGAIVLE